MFLAESWIALEIYYKVNRKIALQADRYSHSQQKSQEILQWQYFITILLPLMMFTVHSERFVHSCRVLNR